MPTRFPHREVAVAGVAPGSDRFFVTEQYGKVYLLPPDRDCRTPDLFLDLGDLVARLNEHRPAGEELVPGAIFHLTFHPDFARNRFCFLCMCAASQQPPVPVLARRRHEIGESVEKLNRCELDDAADPRPR